MFNGKMKAVTFSFDDGVTQDLRLIDLFNKYGMRASFNLISGEFGVRESKIYGKNDDILIYRDRVIAKDIKMIYRNHEVCSHTVNHPRLSELSDEDIIYQVDTDIEELSRLVGYRVRGMAYPFCTPSDHAIEVVREKTNACFARTTDVTYGFDMPSDLFRFNCTVRHHEKDIVTLAKDFVNLKTDEPKLFSVWGHSYEFDIRKDWDKFEEVLRILAGSEDIFYGTNSEVLLGDRK